MRQILVSFTDPNYLMENLSLDFLIEYLMCQKYIDLLPFEG